MIEAVNKHDNDSSRKQDPTYGGGQYRWRYDEYKRTLEEKRKRADKRSSLRFAISVVIIGVICIAILVMALLHSYSKKEKGTADRENAAYLVSDRSME